MEKRYFMFTFEDAYDDSFGDSHKFRNEIALEDNSFLFKRYDNNHISKREITKEEYDEWNENN